MSLWQEFKIECVVGPFLMTQIAELYLFIALALHSAGALA